MTNPDGGRDQTSAGGDASEPTASGYEPPPIEQAQPDSPSSGGPGAPTDLTPDYGTPPAYGYPPPSPAYDQPGYPPGYGQASAPGPEYPPPPPAYPGGFGSPYDSTAGGYPPPPPPGYQPYGGYGSYGGYGPAPGKTNALAVWALVSSLLGFLCCIGSIAGIALGVVSLNQIKQNQEGGHGMAMAGVVIGVVSLLINLIVGVAVINV